LKQYIKHKNITALLTDCNVRTNTGSSYSNKNSQKQHWSRAYWYHLNP